MPSNAVKCTPVAVPSLAIGPVDVDVSSSVHGHSYVPSHHDNVSARHGSIFANSAEWFACLQLMISVVSDFVDVLEIGDAAVRSKYCCALFFRSYSASACR